MNTITLAVWSDVHAGSTVAVCPNSVDLDDGGYYHSAPVQQELYRAWMNGVDRLEEAWKANGQGPLGLLFNGDCVEGDHHGTQQLISRDIGVHKAAFRALAEAPISLQPDWIWISRGTEAHVGKSGGYEESIAKSMADAGFPIQKDPDTDRFTSWHWHLSLNGHRISASHHGRMGRRPWTKGSNLELLAKHVAINYLERGEDPPSVCIRSHFHEYLSSATPPPYKKGTQIIATPAWQLHTAHAHKVVTEEISDIGLVILTITPDRITHEPVLYPPKRSTVWTP